MHSTIYIINEKMHVACMVNKTYGRKALLLHKRYDLKETFLSVVILNSEIVLSKYYCVYKKD